MATKCTVPTALALLIVLVSFLVFLVMNSMLSHKCARYPVFSSDTRHLMISIPDEIAQFNLTVVMPYPAMNRSTVLDSLHRIARVGSPCSINPYLITLKEIYLAKECIEGIHLSRKYFFLPDRAIG